jgi:hypothetical protein
VIDEAPSPHTRATRSHPTPDQRRHGLRGLVLVAAGRPAHPGAAVAPRGLCRFGPANCPRGIRSHPWIWVKPRSICAITWRWSGARPTHHHDPPVLTRTITLIILVRRLRPQSAGRATQHASARTSPLTALAGHRGRPCDHQPAKASSRSAAKGWSQNPAANTCTCETDRAPAVIQQRWPG